MPTTSWGGGMLGGEVGTGYLHRLPHSCRGTIGSSVERKVRAAESDQNKAEKVPVMESHLEMEIEQGAEDPHNKNKQPHELGTRVENNDAEPPSRQTPEEDAKLPTDLPPPPKIDPGGPKEPPSTPAKAEEVVGESIQNQEEEKEERKKFAGLPTPPKMQY